MKTLVKSTLLCSTLALFAACNSGVEGEAATTTEAKEIAQAPAKEETASTTMAYAVNTTASSVKWVGSKPTGEHSGTINVKSGSLDIDNGQLKGGSFILDMPSITVTDLEGDSKADLEGHLKNADFFNVEKYTEGKFEIASINPLPEDKDGNTHLIGGNLSLMDSVKHIEFPAKIEMTDNGLKASTPQFKINRLDWGIVYKSKVALGISGDKFIHDEMGIQIELTATK